MTINVSRKSKLQGTIRPPSDKSMTHRAYIFAALANPGTSEIFDPLDGEDCRATLDIVQALGATTAREKSRTVITSPHLFRSPTEQLNCGNSGTTMRLMVGVLAGQKGVSATLFGDTSLSKRPMSRVVDPLRLMGAQIEGERAPIRVVGSNLSAIEYVSPVASAQVKSCLLLAGKFAEGITWVSEPSLSRNHTELMLRGLGVDLLERNETTVGIQGGTMWNSFSFTPPADISSAAFFLCGAAMMENSNITLRDVSINPTRTGILDVLSMVGVSVKIENATHVLGEPRADLTLVTPSTRRPFSISGSLVPRLIDEIPILAVLATQCDGVSTIRDARELRVKESDRINKVADGLRKFGARVETFEDGMDIEGPVQLTGATIDAEGDHRIAMAFAMAGLIAEGQTQIQNADSVQTSYPEFFEHLTLLSG